MSKPLPPAEASWSRRRFLAAGASACVLAAVGPGSASRPPFLELRRAKDLSVVEARFYEKLPNRKIRCKLCPRECVIDDQERGYCGVRENRGGTYYTLVHSRPVSIHVDPIEKKPLFHFLPGTEALSLATVGCNVECKFCQNWQISQVRPEQMEAYEASPALIAELARESGSPTIAYTYTEPVVFAEYMYDCAVEGRKRGIRSVMISNGYIQREAMLELCSVLDAVKIDLKAFTQRFYTELVAGELKPVLDTLKLLVSRRMWTEIVYLMIPTKNDAKQEIREMCRWIVSELGPDVPVHFTRFYPQYRLRNLPPTPLATLRMAREIALEEGIRFAYIGNVPGEEGENTYCPHCHVVLIRRAGYSILENNLRAGRCSKCGEKIPGVWS
ncbi:MAG: AmmeMemoRadiSam system radical SAM enzyme [candidate division KSB1 bacterium]|nr:AmmeMemoRadiSam system radical SAM enzyme [candidate division KSB1 bacterium]